MNDVHPPGLPLTTAQRGLWVGQKLASVEATLNIAEAVEIHGPIDPTLFQRAPAGPPTAVSGVRAADGKLLQQAAWSRSWT